MNNIRCAHRAAVRVESVCERMAFSVLKVVRENLASQHRGLDSAVFYSPAVFAVVEHGETEAVI